MSDSWLTKTDRGWVEPRPTPCERCGSARALVGFRHCLCGSGPLSGGHRTWRCRDCNAERVIGCAGQTGVAPMGIPGV